MMRLQCIGAVLVLAMGTIASAQAQMAGPSPQPTSRSTSIPLSGRQQSGTVTTQQSAQPGSGGSVEVVSPSIQVQGPYAGSVRDPSATGPMALSLAEAVRRGLEFNLGQIGASAALRQARAQQRDEMGVLLPSVSASASETGAKIDLEAEGLSASTLSSFGSLGLAFPTTVGPFHYYEAAANVSDNLLNLTALHNLRSAAANAQGSQLNAQNTREAVVLAVCGSYMQVLASEALLAYQKDQVRYAQASYDQAAAQYQAGTKAQIDSTRSLVQLHSEQERLASEQADARKQKLLLARLIGIPLDAEITLTSKMNSATTVPLPLDAALRQALSSRQDLKAAEAQLRVAEEALKAARSERLPTAAVQGNYGIEGVNPNKGTSVFSATASVNLPIFNGGRIQADTDQANAAVVQRRAEIEDQRGQVELDVRNSYLDLEVATGQVKLAAENRVLALDTLRQSLDRFTAGVADSVEVVQSQEILGSANRDYVNALYAENLARISLARAMGEAEQSVPTLLQEK